MTAAMEHRIMDCAARSAAGYVAGAATWTHDMTAFDGQGGQTFHVVEVLRLTLDH